MTGSSNHVSPVVTTCLEPYREQGQLCNKMRESLLLSLSLRMLHLWLWQIFAIAVVTEFTSLSGTMVEREVPMFIPATQHFLLVKFALAHLTMKMMMQLCLHLGV